MVNLQLICRGVTVEDVRARLIKTEGIQFIERRGHIAAVLSTEECRKRASEILEICRRNMYAYLRLTAWEEGGGYERTGRAICVSGLQGEPLDAIAVRAHRDKANRQHALFGSRDGLVCAIAQRDQGEYSIALRESRIDRTIVKPIKTLLNLSFRIPPSAWLENFDLAYDMYTPVVRAALSKVDCLYCTHIHYGAVKERESNEGVSGKAH